jgi:putative FmdB family regulatory protein
MPTYEYACSSCHHEWEFEQSIKDAPLTECPSCHQEAARRQISRGTGFILKGSGWYSDLYSSSSNKPGASTGSGSAAESKESTESKPSTDSGGKSEGGATGTSGSSSAAAGSSAAAA